MEIQIPAEVQKAVREKVEERINFLATGPLASFETDAKKTRNIRAEIKVLRWLLGEVGPTDENDQ